jgi:signal transduction histidine kinase
MLALAGALLPGAPQARPNVLLLFDEDNDLPGLAVINRTLREVLRRELEDDVEIYSESLNVSQFKSPGHYGVMRDHLHRKYEGRRIDLVVAVMEPALDFLLRHGQAVFGDVPIVFCGADATDVQRRVLRPNVTGVLVERDFAPTLDIALRLHPGARNVFVVGGTSRFDRQLQAIARGHLQPFDSRIGIAWLTELAMEDLLGEVSSLPPHSVIYYLSLFADGAGHTFTPHQALARLAAVANAPIYASVDQFIGLGAVGGHVYSLATHGEQAATIALRILRGEAPSAIPVVALAAQSNVFDARQLERWGVDKRLLPAGSALEFRSPSAWNLYRRYIVGGISLILLQSILVVALLVNRAQRRRAEKEREESEERRRRTEEEARRQRDELAHAQRVATLGELTASIAHELNQPLTAILANAQSARMLLAADHSDPELNAALLDLVADASRAGETVHRLRALFRKEPAARTAIDVNALIDDVLRLLAQDIRSRDIRVRFLSGDSLPTIVGDSVQLRQVIINLLVNAAEAIDAAGEAPREIRVLTSLPDAAHIAVAIGDSGIGVKEADLERMFGHFVSSKPHGLGIGLAISRSIVEAHGGRIWATRNDVRGTTLHLLLPAERAHRRSIKESPSDSELPHLA